MCSSVAAGEHAPLVWAVKFGDLGIRHCSIGAQLRGSARGPGRRRGRDEHGSELMYLQSAYGLVAEAVAKAKPSFARDILGRSALPEYVQVCVCVRARVCMCVCVCV